MAGIKNITELPIPGRSFFIGRSQGQGGGVGIL